MKQVNFSALEIQGIDGSKQQVDIQDELANLIYMQGQSIQDCELGRKLYLAGRKDNVLNNDADRTVSLNTDESQIVKRVMRQLPYIIRKAVLSAMGEEEEPKE